MGKSGEMASKSPPVSLVQLVKRERSYNKIFVDFYGDEMRSPEKFYTFDEEGSRLVQTHPPKEIHPENG